MPMPRNVSSQGPLFIAFLSTWAGAVCLPIGRSCSRSLVQVEDGRGKNGQVILTGAELFHFPGLGEGLGVELWVAKRFLKPSVVKGVVDTGVESIGWRRGGGLGQWEGVGWDPGLGGRAA